MAGRYHSMDDPKGMGCNEQAGQADVRPPRVLPNSRSNTSVHQLWWTTWLPGPTRGFIPIGEVVEGLPIIDMLYTGYGATEAHQFDFENGGKAYVDRTYPKLDRILTATIVPVPQQFPRCAAPKQYPDFVFPPPGRAV